MKKIFLLILAVLLILPGCGTKEAGSENSRIYYLDEEGTTLLSCEIRTEAEGGIGWLQEVKEKLNAGEEVPAGGQPLLIDGARIKSVQENAGVITVNMNEAYLTMDPSRQFLVRAGITKTFTQEESVSAVLMKAEDKPLMDSRGKEIGPMAANSFVDEQSDGINNYRSKKMTLYFTNEEGTQLIPETRTVYYSSNTAVEQAVVNELIFGPVQTGHFRTLPAETNVLNVTIQDDICYVNFDESIENASFELDPSIQIYSIVDSLYSVCDVEQVSFSINGSSNVRFKDDVNLDQVFSPDPRLKEE